MGCASSTAVKEPDARKKDEGDSRSKSGMRSDKRQGSMYAEPAMSQGDVPQRNNSIESLGNITMGITRVDDQTPPETQSFTSPEQSTHLEDIEDKPKPIVSPSNMREESKGSIIRNGVYYSESELAEEGTPWQPKYWTAERIGKWVEDTEYPEGMKWTDVRKSIVQMNKKSSSAFRRSRPPANSIG